MKNSGKTVSNRCATESVAVMTTRRAPASRSRNGKLADDVLTTTTGRAAGEERGPLRRLEIGADEVELRVDAVERAVADEHDEQQIVARHHAADRVEMLPHVGGRRGVRRRRACRSAP